ETGFVTLIYLKCCTLHWCVRWTLDKEQDESYVSFDFVSKSVAEWCWQRLHPKLQCHIEGASQLEQSRLGEGCLAEILSRIGYVYQRLPFSAVLQSLRYETRKTSVYLVLLQGSKTHSQDLQGDDHRRLFGKMQPLWTMQFHSYVSKSHLLPGVV